MAWQPISTAPKDGTPFLGYIPGRPNIRIFWWSDRQFEKFGNGWNFYGNGFLSPTRWQPLPAPPED